MLPLSGADELGRYKDVLKDWKFTGYINWDPRPAEWLRETLGELSQKAVGQLMYEHCDEVDQTVENRPEWRDDYAYHYDFRLLIGGQKIYIETVLEDDYTIRVADIKLA